VELPAYLIVGRTRKAHGIRGEVVVEPLTDAPAAVFAAGHRVFLGTLEGDLESGEPTLTIVSAAPVKNGLLLVKFEGFNDRNGAERLAGKYLLLPRSELKEPGESEAFLHEIVGMQVELESGEPIGEVLDLFEMPQGVLIDVAWRGGRVTLPLHPDFLRDIKREERRIVMKIPDGLLD
jgi:16S rRNA processing protein RimM